MLACFLMPWEFLTSFLLFELRLRGRQYLFCWLCGRWTFQASTTLLQRDRKEEVTWKLCDCWICLGEYIYERWHYLSDVSWNSLMSDWGDEEALWCFGQMLIWINFAYPCRRGKDVEGSPSYTVLNSKWSCFGWPSYICGCVFISLAMRSILLPQEKWLHVLVN